VRINLARLLIGAVFVMNVQCALLFLVRPGAYAPGFELAGAVGQAAVQGMGVLFLMWNVPYAVALWHPVRHRLALFESVIMQVIGLAGELFVRSALPAVHTLARFSLGRFILFDALGLLALHAAVALLITLFPPSYGSAYRRP
jgi:hypothetical protein